MARIRFKLERGRKKKYLYIEYKEENRKNSDIMRAGMSKENIWKLITRMANPKYLEKKAKEKKKYLKYLFELCKNKVLKIIVIHFRQF